MGQVTTIVVMIEHSDCNVGYSNISLSLVRADEQKVAVAVVCDAIQPRHVKPSTAGKGHLSLTEL